MKLWLVQFVQNQKALFLWPLGLVVCQEHYLVLLPEYLGQVVFELLHNMELWLVQFVQKQKALFLWPRALILVQFLELN